MNLFRLIQQYRKLRRRKFSGTTVFQDIFDEIVRKCIAAGLVTRKLLITDSTHIKANAKSNLREVIEVPDTPSEYMQKLDREAYETGLIKEPAVYSERTKSVIKSTTNPESGLLNHPGKPNVFCYLNHQTCDSENRIITDVFVTPGNTNDSTPHMERIENQIDKFRFNTEAICADGGYDSCEIYDAMFKKGIKTFIFRRAKPVFNANYEDNFRGNRFVYNAHKNMYICPNGKELRYSTFNKKDCTKRYRAKTSDCQNCPFKKQCIGKSNNSRFIERIMHEEARHEQKKC